MKKLLALIMVLAMLLCSCNKTEDKVETTTDANGYIHQYDEDGKLTASILYEDQVEISRIEYSYDNEGKLVLLKTISGGELVQTITRTYNGDALATTTKEFKDVDDGVICKEYSEIDEKEQPIFTIYYEDGQWVGRENYGYNDKGDLVKKDRVDEAGDVITSEVYTYNQVNQIIRTDCYEFGVLSFYYEYQYDNLGNMSKAFMYTPDGTLISEQ